MQVKCPYCGNTGGEYTKCTKCSRLIPIVEKEEFDIPKEIDKEEFNDILDDVIEENLESDNDY